MIEVFVIAGLTVAVVLVILMRRSYLNYVARRFSLKELGHIIWKDTGDEEPFYNKKYKVFGKPDLLIESEKGLCAVEYKSTGRKIYDRDWIQVYSAALAVRGEHHFVRWVCIKTPIAEEVRELPTDDNALFQMIHQYVSLARLAQSGANCPPTDRAAKCYRCSMAEHCVHRSGRLRKAG